MNNSLRHRNYSQKIKPYLFIMPAALMLGLVILFPVVKVLIYSFQDNIINDPYFAGIENYKAVLSDTRFPKMLRFTVIFTLGSVAMHITIGVIFAVLLNAKINKVALTIYRVIFVFPWVFTAAVVALVWQLMLQPQGVVNAVISSIAGKTVLIEWLGKPSLAVLSIMIINAWRGYPTCMVSFLAGLQNIPEEMYEAASIDGAGKMRQFFALTLPALKPVILSVGMLDAIWTMNLFPLIWLTTGGGPLGMTETIATLTYRMSFVEFKFGGASALAVIGLVITMIGVLFYMRAQKVTDE